MADTMKSYPVECPNCEAEFDAEIPAEALLPNVDPPFCVECPECGEECDISYDATTDSVELLEDFEEPDDSEDPEEPETSPEDLDDDE